MMLNQLSGPTSLAGCVGILVVLYGLTKAIYNVYFHPLRRFPGPKLWAASGIPSALNLMGGKPHRNVLEMHKKYGDVVRIGPSELAFAHAGAWRDIFGHLKAGMPEMGKEPKYTNEEMDRSLIAASRDRHSRMRRVMSNAFSAQAMTMQQPLINRYIDLLIKRLREHSKEGSNPLDLVKWYDWTIFDIIGDLSFGEPFGCLENSKPHPWVDMLFDSLRLIPIGQAMAEFPLFSTLGPIIMAFATPKSVRESRLRARDFVQQALDKRLNLKSTRPDFVASMISKVDNQTMSRRELEDNSLVLTTAGSETTATTLAGVTYLLCRHPDVLAKLKAEILHNFQSESEINIQTVQNLTYMLAVLKETMRIYPPVAISLPRRTPSGGSRIGGAYVAEGTTVGIWQYAAYHSPSNFSQPDDFIPERWLGDQRFVDDHKDVFQPFSHGPRNCIGMNLAYTEMRLILARMVWNFDMALATDSLNWQKEQSVFFFWKKPPLNVLLKPAKNSQSG
ncbi:hypothetical protein NUW58_g1264 [Xylaria curta]|uniref:Uncharacterized protein n=1 Tax=Xylaria curta TaxID=42375 RepID=A0ACC1PNP6_9PEZI|nr:hypothetical protein NUW58_g1264 [Xylaria curta]